MAINKPPYIATLEDRSSPVSVLSMARDYVANAQVCHRLDKETSGVLLLAKNNQAYKNAAGQFSDRTVKKVYHAVVNGVHEFIGEEINLDLFISPSGNVRVKKGAKPSTTTVSTIEKFKYHTLVACIPLTGRMHQIRVHLAAVGAPLVADTIYGGSELYLSRLKRNYRPKSGIEERPLMPRVALHAYALSFEDIDGKKITIECPYPKDIQSIIVQLKRYT